MHISIDFRKFEAFKRDMERLRGHLQGEWGCDMTYVEVGDEISRMVSNSENGDLTDFVSALCDAMGEWRNLVDK
jgi:hypothetical protein